MKYLKTFKPVSVNEALSTTPLPGRKAATGSTSPIVVYAYTAEQNNPQLYKKLMWGGTNELSQDLKRIPNTSFKVTRSCDEATANYTLTIKDGQSTAGEGQARLNPASYHADPSKKFQYTVEGVQPDIEGKNIAGVWVIDIAASQPLAAEGTFLNTGKVLSQFKQSGKVVGQFVPAKGNTITFEARSAIMHVVYAPKVDNTVAPKEYTFKRTFKYNSIEVDLTSKESQQTLAQLLGDLKSGFKYTVISHGNASQVPTKYMGGNEKLATDRATALVQAVQQSAQKAGINWKQVVINTTTESAVTGPEWKAGSSEAPYEPYQFVTIKLVPEKGQMKAV